MRSYLQQNWRQMCLALLCSVLLGAGFLLYTFLIGAPKTRARNLYNEAQLALGEDKIEQAVQLMSKAYDSWPEEYILQEIESLSAAYLVIH